jgi:cytoskeletal protein CcmA (bactofilin family)
MAWNRSTDSETPSSPPARPSAASSGGSRPSILGPSLRFQGDLTGSEDLRIEGTIKGTIRCDKQNVIVANSGHIEADIHARSICVEGQVKGNLYGEEEIVIRPSGKLEGNITAPSVGLENGAKFRGAIDMEPKKANKPEASSARQATDSNDKSKPSDAGVSTASAAPAKA